MTPLFPSAADASLPRLSAVDFLTTPAKQASTLREVEHRPWPLPPGTWLMGQTWKDLLFAHWRVPPETVRPLVPPQLSLDVYEGSAWVGVTPFEVTGLRLITMPPVPVVSAFLELNVRTYVTAENKPGIFFFSLDAASSLAVRAARRFYRLPYFRALMSATRSAERIEFSSERLRRDGRGYELRAVYVPVGDLFTAERGSLEYFLAERYCLYTVDEGRLFRADIHHPPWPLQPAEADLRANTMAPPPVELAGEPLLHFAGRQDVVIWPLRPVG